MAEVSKTNHLNQRKGVWYYNRRVPKHILPLINDGRISKAGFIRYSLETKNKEEAIKRGNLADVEWDALFEQAELGKPTALNHSQAVRLIQAYVDRKNKA